nr:ATP-binding protein [Streptomyces zinciresistens]
MGAGHLSVEYDPRPLAVREARRRTRRQLEGWGLTDVADVAETAELLVSELATLALLRSASRFRLTLSAAHGTLRCEVRDTGDRARAVRAARGSAGGGMFLVDALSRRWGCHQDGPGRTVWFELGTCGSRDCGGRRTGCA